MRYALRGVHSSCARARLVDAVDRNYFRFVYPPRVIHRAKHETTRCVRFDVVGFRFVFFFQFIQSPCFLFHGQNTTVFLMLCDAVTGPGTPLLSAGLSRFTRNNWETQSTGGVSGNNRGRRETEILQRCTYGGFFLLVHKNAQFLLDRFCSTVRQKTINCI